jgi:hypothetical protein
VELAFHLAMGVSLAACAGLRAFLPILVVGVAGRLGFVELAGPLQWMADAPALILFGVAVAAELAADKFPLVDHLLDVVEVAVKPVAGALLMAAVVGEWSPLTLTVVSMLAGGSIAGSVHLAKAKLRLLSSLSTGGLGNPALSLAEDSGAFLGSVGALVVPLIVLLVLVLFLAAAFVVVRRRTRRAA